MRRRVRAVLVAVGLVIGACTNEGAAPEDASLSGARIEILGPWQQVEAERFGRVLRRFERNTGATVAYTSTGGEDIATVLDARLAAGDPPDLAMLPQPGLLRRYARNGRIVPISGLVGAEVDDGWSPEWRRLATVDGELYGLWFKAANKSLVWYDIATFERAGIVPPSDPDELAAVANAVVSSGVAAFAIAGGAQWTLTDWFENLYLRLAGPDAYDALGDRRIPWTDPTVVEALGLMGRLVSPPFATGGSEGVPGTSFAESVSLVFGAPPRRAAMVMEGDFVSGEITGSTDALLGVDADVFPFPDVDPSRRLVVGGGDAVVMFEDTPASRALLRDLSTPAAAEVWARLGGFVSPNEDVDLGVYPDAISEGIARGLIEAGDGFRFDLSDTQPSAFGATTGQGMFGILADFAADPSDPAATAERLERAAEDAHAALSAEGPPAA